MSARTTMGININSYVLLCHTCVAVSYRDFQSYRRFGSQKPYDTNVSDVPRSLQS